MYILYAKINYKKMTITILFLIIKLFSPYGEYLVNKIIIKKLVFFQTFRTQMFQSVFYSIKAVTRCCIGEI
jgi:hypothetical protein